MIWGNLLGFALAAQGAPATLTLDQAIQIAESNAFSVRTSNSSVAKTRERLRELYGNLGPRVTLTGQYLRYAERQLSFQPGVAGTIESKNVGANLSLPLDLVGSVRSTIKAGSWQVKAAEEDLRSALNEVRLSVRNAFYDVQKAKGAILVAEAALKSAREQERTTQAAKDAGNAAQVDVLRVQTDVRQYESDLLSSQNALELAKAALNSALARPIQTAVEVDGASAVPATQWDEDRIRVAATSYRPEIVSLKYAQKALKGVTNAQRGGTLPSLTLGVNHQRNIAAGPNTREATTTGTVGLNWPIFDSGITRSRVRQAQEDEKQAQIRLEQTELSVSLQVRVAVTNYQNAKDRQAVAERRVELATETLRLSELRDKAGEGTLLEVLDAQRQLTLARNQLNNAKYEALSAYAALQRAVGRDDIEAAVAEAAKGGKE